MGEGVASPALAVLARRSRGTAPTLQSRAHVLSGQKPERPGRAFLARAHPPPEAGGSAEYGNARSGLATTFIDTTQRGKGQERQARCVC